MIRQNIRYLLSILLLLFSCQLSAKILIITHNYNRPEFINIQLRSFNKFLKDDFDYIVFNDAVDKNMINKINCECNILGVRCIKVDQEKRPVAPTVGNKVVWASIRHAQVLRYSMDVLAAEYDDIVVFIDNDMFLLKEFSIRTFLGDADIAGLKQKRGDFEYIWPNLLILNIPHLPHKDTLQFFPLVIDNVVLDTGGSLYSYLASNPTVKVLYFPQENRFCLDYDLKPFTIINSMNHFAIGSVQCQACALHKTQCNHTETILEERGFDKRIINHVKNKTLPRDCEFVLGDTFFHYRRGSWGDKKSDKRKVEALRNFICDFIDN